MGSMKPGNFEKEGCDYTSSNCVIWNGPDIDCLNLCKGDSVTEVVYKLAQELCTLLETFNIEAYELSCLNLGDCGPKDFKALIQLLIERICELEGVEPSSTPTTSEGCPDCTVNIAECFYYENAQGDTMTTMQLTDYVTTIGNRICTLSSQIETINKTLTNHENRLKSLETAESSEVDLPKVTPTCVTDNPGTSQEMDVVLAALEVQFCELTGATGGPTDIYTALAKQCAGLNTDNKLSGSGTMENISGWEGTVNNLAHAMNNMWLTICDIRSAIKTIQANCCPGACDGVDVTMIGTLAVDTLTLVFNGSIPAGYTSCAAGGSLVTITDANGASTKQTVNVVSNLNNAAGIDIDLSATPVDTALNLSISMELCVKDSEGTQCSQILTDSITNTSLCPTVNYTPTETSIGYTFGWTQATAATFNIELYDSTGTTLITTNTSSVGGVATVTGSFTGLTAGTQYKIKLNIVVDGVETECPISTVTTNSAPCLPATGLTAAINIT